ncbi:MAG TPA: hypothetical protein PK113_01115, partial [Bacillota bacterium]|nr:hypothetical protein [Bacillota bacterium]
MKKVYILTLSLLMVFLFIGCNKETTNDTETSLVTTENTDVVTEEITTGFTPVEGDLHVVYPENLVIEGRTLYWDPVENAQAYAVFINGEWAANVETNSYNFTELGENKLIFQVMTKAEIGYGDSGMSVRIAYNPNRIAEIASVDAYLETVNMSGTPGFAEELVNKVMS